MIDYGEITATLIEKRKELEAEIKGIDCVLESIYFVLGKKQEPAAKINGQGRPRSTKSQPFVNSEVIKPSNMKLLGSKELSDKEKKAAYMLAWRTKRAEEQGKVFNPRVPKPQKDTAAHHQAVASKFSLERAFDIDNPKDISIMMSYLISWKATGRLDPEQVSRLITFEGRNQTKLSDAERTMLRDIFYLSRGNVIENAKEGLNY